MTPVLGVDVSRWQTPPLPWGAWVAWGADGLGVAVLLYMLPVNAKYNMLNATAANTEHAGQLVLTKFIRGIKLPYFMDLFIGKFGVAILFSMNLTLAPFFYHIQRIVPSRSQKQVGWITARRIVAFMTNIKPIRDFPICYYPCHAMRLNAFAIKTKTAVPVMGKWPRVFPAFIWATALYPSPKFLNLLLLRTVAYELERARPTAKSALAYPKLIRLTTRRFIALFAVGIKWGKLWAHLEPPSSFAMPLGVHSAAGVLCCGPIIA